jgi:hypothetical protein
VQRSAAVAVLRSLAAKRYHYGQAVREMKAILPAIFGLATLLCCCWNLYRKNIDFLPNQKDKVEVTVIGPDGQVIRPVAAAPKDRQ